MARRTDHSRHELTEMAVVAAREILEREGLGALTARRVAKRIGYTPGTLYNLFENLDALIISVRGRTLDELCDRLSTDTTHHVPITRSLEIASVYLEFVYEHPKLWNAMFEHVMPDAPEWYHEKVMHLLGLIAEALAPLFGDHQEGEALRHAHILWASLQGICSIQMSGKLILSEATNTMAETLVRNYIAGLEALKA